MPQKTKGFSLVELMVAVTIGLIILVSVSAIFITSKKSYNVQDRMARLQENARFAMQYIMKDVRLGGFYGCLTDFNDNTVKSSLNSTGGLAFQMTIPISGLKAGATTWYPTLSTSMPTGTVSVTSKESSCPNIVGSRCTNTDAIAVLLANFSDASLALTAEMADGTDVVTVGSSTLIKTNDVAVVSDCSNADVFQVTGITNAGSNMQLQHAISSTPVPGNATATLGHGYGMPGTNGNPAGSLIKFVYRRYYIGTGASGLPSLFRDGTEGQQELVEGIESMRILYGVDTDSPPDGIPNVYLKPNTTDPTSGVSLITADDWKKVISVRVGILAMTVSDKAETTDTDTTAYDIDGDGNTDYTAPGDRNKRRVFLSTVMLRNKHE
jgi:type IV pilus assembly protein PilW